MPIWNGSTGGGITQAEAQAACEAAIIASNLPTTADVQTSCEAAILAAVGVEIPTVVQIQAGLASQASVDALPTAAEIATAVAAQAAASAALQAAWGTVLFVKAQYFNATVGNLTGKFIAAPGAGFRIEILSWAVTTFATVGSFSWSSGATTNIDTGPDVQMRFLAKGSQVSAVCMSPFFPLYVLAENANFGITMDLDAEVVADIQYRVVAV